MITNGFFNQKGFTLIEVTIAMAVLVIGILGALSMQLFTIRGNSNAIAVSRSVQESSAALDMAESLDYTNNANTVLAQGTNKPMATLFGAAQQFSGTVTYDVVDKNGNDIKAIFALTHDDFPLASAKEITIKSVQRVSGADKTISLQYIKIDR